MNNAGRTPSARRCRPCSLRFVVPFFLLIPWESVSAQRTAEPDPRALAAATDLQRAGATAATVAREMVSTHRQTGA